MLLVHVAHRKLIKAGIVHSLTDNFVNFSIKMYLLISKALLMSMHKFHFYGEFTKKYFSITKNLNLIG